MGDCGSAGWWSVGTEDLPVDAGAEAGPFHAGPAEAACGADEDNGQRGHFLHAAHALYIHLQVGRRWQVRESDLVVCLTLQKGCVNFLFPVANRATTSQKVQ